MRTKAFVLKTVWINPCTKYLTLLSESTGKINAIAKPKIWDAPIKYDLFSLSVFEINMSKNIPEVRNAKLIKENIPGNMDEFKYLCNLANLFVKYALEQNPRLFKLFSVYSKVKNNFLLAQTMATVKLCMFEGVFPRIQRCIKCGSNNPSLFCLEEGGVLCNRCGDGELKWNKSLTSITNLLLKKSFNELSRKNLRYANIKHIKEIFEKHLEYRLGK